MALDPQPQQALAEPSTSLLATSSSHAVSDDSDSDAVNTSNSKVYFGRFQTPEKNIASRMDFAQAHEPIQDLLTRPLRPRRSPRLASPPKDTVEPGIAEPSEQDAELDAEPQPSHVTEGWVEAPLPDFLREDEPSSAIASRIMRAHDNPSPPPRAIRDSFSPRHSAPFGTSPLQSPSASDASRNQDMDLQAAELLPETTPPPFDFNDESASPTITMARDLPASPTFTQPSLEANVGEEREIEQDLIEFDRSIVMSSPSQPGLVSPTPRHVPQGFKTVDDLLFSSPCQIPLPSSNEPSLVLQTASPMGSTKHPGGVPDSDNVQISLPPMEELEADVTAQPTHRELALSPPPNTTATPLVPSPVPDAAASVENTPPRRSARLSNSVPPTVVESIQGGSLTPTLRTSRGQKRRRSGSSHLSLSPKKVEWRADPDNSDDETEDAAFSSKSRKTKRLKRMSEGGEIMAQAADSLSPRSADILRNIVATELGQGTIDNEQPDEDGAERTELRPSELEQVTLKDSLDEEVHTPQRPQAGTTANKAPVISSSVQRPPPGVYAHQMQTPVKGSSQRVTTHPVFSSEKLQLSQSALEDPNRSPARRIQLRPESSTSSEHSNSRINAPGARTPVFSRPPVNMNDPNRSPAKRIAMPLPRAQLSAKELSAPLKAGRRVPPKSSRPITAGRTPTVSSTAAPSKPTSISKSLSTKPPTKPLQGLAESKPALASSRSTQATSRIPRSGIAKPATSSAKAASKLPMPSTSKVGSKLRAPKPVTRPQPQTSKPTFPRLTQPSGSSSSGSDDSSSGRDMTRPNQTARTASKALATNRRMRENDSTTAWPMIQARRVTPGMFGGPVKASIAEASKPHTSAESPVPPSPAKQPSQMRPIQGREVVKGTLQDFEFTNPALISLEARREAREKEKAEQERLRQEQLQREKEQEEREREAAEAAAAASKAARPLADSAEPERYAPLLRGPSLQAFTFECSSQSPGTDHMDIDTLPLSSLREPAVETQQGDSQIIPPELIGTRKSSRSRRPTNSSDEFIDEFPLLPTAAAARRRVAGPTRAKAGVCNPAFVFTINGAALTSLTNNNTARNQHYHAEPEVRVVRKEGNRPESPAVKLRTVVEKQKEEADKMRAERAARRRAEDSLDMSEMDHDKAFLEDSLKHRRGPGEDEDFETPLRPANGKKSVKWDRGLEAVVFLDEIAMDAQKRPKAEMPKKGCLAVKATLDGFGNALNAQAPLDLSPEKVVVTKFVYDNDEEADIPPPPPPPRTRGRKSR